jgi:hypothetical protein
MAHIKDFAHAPQLSFVHLMSGPARSWPKKEFAHAHDPAGYSHFGAIGSATNLALQPGVGLLPQRRTGNSADHRDRLDVDVRLDMAGPRSAHRAALVDPGVGLPLAEIPN